MGNESGGGYRYVPEIAVFRNLDSMEAARGRGGEADAEAENRSWIADIIDPAKLERVRQYPAYAEGSSEHALFAVLEAELNEKGADMDPTKRARLRNLVGVLRVLFYPNLDEKERGYSDFVLQEVDFSKSTYEVTDETRDDVREVWRTFGLRVPSRQAILSDFGVQAVNWAEQFRLQSPR